MVRMSKKVEGKIMNTMGIKVLFLDIDGVLNCMMPTPSDDHEFVDLDEWRYGFNPDLVARLR